MQRFEIPDAPRNVPLLGAVGPLQFEIVQYRLESEYGATSRIEPTPWTRARWLAPDTRVSDLRIPSGVSMVTDVQGQPVLLFAEEWNLNYFCELNPAAKIASLPFAGPSTTVAHA